jgi:hypothetical protein
VPELSRARRLFNAKIGGDFFDGLESEMDFG